eukprot:UN00596
MKTLINHGKYRESHDLFYQILNTEKLIPNLALLREIWHLYRNTEDFEKAIRLHEDIKKMDVELTCLEYALLAGSFSRLNT